MKVILLLKKLEKKKNIISNYMIVIIMDIIRMKVATLAQAIVEVV